MDKAEIQNIVQAVIQASTKAVTLQELCFVFEECPKVETADIQEAIEKLLEEKDGVQELKQVAGGYRYQIKMCYTPFIHRYRGVEGEVEPLGRALLETLAIIAYKQPVSRGEADLIRGKNTAWMVFQQLEERGWIKVVAYGGEGRKAALYGTTREFLEYFNLNSIEDLPDLPALETTLVEEEKSHKIIE